MAEGFLTENLKNRKFKVLYYTEMFFEIVLCKIEDWKNRTIKFIDENMND